jgi:hypothetical protein
MLSSTQKSQKLFRNNCTRITLDIKPVMLPFFTPFVVDIDKHALKPYMAPVNHNVPNETTGVNIVHTLLGKLIITTTQRRWKTWGMMLVS